MQRTQLLIWIAVGLVVGVAVGAINENIPVWTAFGGALGLAMGFLAGRFDSEG